MAVLVFVSNLEVNQGLLSNRDVAEIKLTWGHKTWMTERVWSAQSQLRPAALTHFSFRRCGCLRLEGVWGLCVHLGDQQRADVGPNPICVCPRKRVQDSLWPERGNTTIHAWPLYHWLFVHLGNRSGFPRLLLEPRRLRKCGFPLKIFVFEGT